MAFARGRLAGSEGGFAFLALGPALLMLLLALPLLALAHLALRDFVAPLQMVTGLSCGAAARLLETLLTSHPGAFLLYLLLKILLFAVTGVVVLVGGCLTCCIAFLPVVRADGLPAALLLRASMAPLPPAPVGLRPARPARGLRTLS